MTKSISLSRRQILTFIGLGVHAEVFASKYDNQSDTANTRIISASANSNEDYFVEGLEISSEGTTPWFKHLLPGRAHHIAVNEQLGLYIVISRRPGSWMIVGDLASGEFLQTIELPENRHFFGHGVFSRDGLKFFSVENDLDNLAGNSGLLGVWSFDETLQLVKAREFSTGGVGPHEIVFMPDQLTLAIANGGIRTGADREKLNINEMRPSLVYLDSLSGRLLEQVELTESFHQCSIRHLDVNDEGLVAVAMQFEGEAFLDVPLLALHNRGQNFVFPEISMSEQQQMNQYCGSVRFDESGNYLAVSCPRGNRITFWDVRKNSYISAVRSRDGCGVSAFNGGFLFTAGSGRVSHYSLSTQDIIQLNESGKEKSLWDNHLSLVSRSV